MSDFFNLRQMWPADESIKTSFDLVAVHGLESGSLSTWTNEAGENWLQWVHQKMPAIRVLVFGYPAAQAYLSSDDADDTRSLREGNHRLFTFAEALCGGLRAKRMRNRGPITFIGHGVGGILIKTALSYCSNRQELFGEILSHTLHIIFLDTPHLGLDEEQWNAIHHIPANSRGKFLFSYTSKALQDLVVTFGDVVTRQKIKVTTAWADLIESARNVNRPRPFSVRLGIPLEEALYLHNVSHRTICRFRDENDDNYQTLASVIQAELLVVQQQVAEPVGSDVEKGIWKLTRKTNSDLQRLSKLTADNSTRLNEIQDAVHQQYASRGEPDKFTLDSQHRKSELLTWLWPQPFGINWEKDLDDSSNAVETTCQWILHRKEYSIWQDSEESRLMYIHGIQGCGKSTLAAYLISRFRKSRHHTSFFFCHQTMQSAVVRLTALAYQVLNGLPNDEVIRILSPHRDMTTSPSVSTLTTAKYVLLDALLITAGQYPCYIVLDALDECSDKPAHRDKAEFLKALLELVSNVPFGLKILCTSRNESQILSLMARHRNVVVDLEIKPDYIEEDISTMIATEIDEQPELKNKLVNSSLWEFAVDGLRSSAGGMFLLPKMMIKDLATKVTTQEIRTFFNDLPSDLLSYYMTIMTRIGSRNLGIWKSYDSVGSRVITWLCWAFTDLTVKELEEAVSTSEESSFANLESDIRSSFGCLVTIDEGHIRLSHPSVRRFLLTSPQFRASDLHDRLVRPDPHGYLGSICLQFLRKTNIPLGREGKRFPDAEAESLRLADRYPFLHYATVYWIAHCRASRNPLQFVPNIHALICSDNHNNLVQWYAASLLGRRFFQENFMLLCRLLHNFVLELRRLAARSPSKVDFTLSRIDQISVALRKIWRFVMMWHGVIAAFPFELHALRALIDSPTIMKKDGQQGVLIVHDPVRRIAEFKHFMLEKRHLFSDKCDRFLLTDLSIIMWRSLMPCSPLDRKGVHLLSGHSLNIELYSESIFPGLFPPEGREGRDQARVGSLLAACVVSKNLRFVAIAWPRFEPDNPAPSMTVVKTYMWYMIEIDGGLFLHHVPWTEEEEAIDPCRVDRTWSHSFKGSRGAVAFTRDSQFLWTSGGRYRISDGQFTSPPTFFSDRNLSQVSFSKHATAIAGIRQGSELCVYDLTDHQATFRTSVEGIDHLVDLSPDGSFILALSGSGTNESTHQDQDRSGTEEVCLITYDGRRVVLWSRLKLTTTSHSDETKPNENVTSLITFYNNGGLHAFSENESVLVLCIPTAPDWSLLAFDLEASNIAESKWTVEYSDYLAGAAIMSLAFSPIRERQLHVLDTLSNMRTIEISRRSVDGQSISTLLGNDQPILISAVVKSKNGRHSLYSATIPPQHLEHQEPQVTLWDLKTFQRLSPKRLLASFLRYFGYLKSDNVIVDFDPILQASLDYRLSTGDFDWKTMTISAQLVIEEIKEEINKNIAESELKPDDSVMDYSSQITTKVSFDASASLCFLLSMIYTPIAMSSTAQRRWSLSVVMDVRHLATASKMRKTVPYMITVGTVCSESFLTTYHEETKTLAYCVSVVYSDRDDDGTFTVVNHLFIMSLSESEEFSIESKTGPSYIKILSYEMDGLHVSDLVFSPCGRFLYWSAYWNVVEIYQYDTWRQTTIRKFKIPSPGSYDDYRSACFSLSFNQDRLHLSLILSSIIHVFQLPACAWPRTTRTARGEGWSRELPAASTTSSDHSLDNKTKPSESSDSQPQDKKLDRSTDNSDKAITPGADTAAGRGASEGEVDQDVYLARAYFLGPHFLRTATNLRIIWPDEGRAAPSGEGLESEDETIAIIRCPNYLRKDGINGASPDQAQSPVVLSTLASTLPDWQRISVDGLVEDLLEKVKEEKEEEENQATEKKDNEEEKENESTKKRDCGEDDTKALRQAEKTKASRVQLHIPGAWDEDHEGEDEIDAYLRTDSRGQLEVISPEGPREGDSKTTSEGSGLSHFFIFGIFVIYLSLVAALFHIFP